MTCCSFKVPRFCFEALGGPNDYAAAAKGAKLSFAVTNLKTQASVDPVSPPQDESRMCYRVIVDAYVSFESFSKIPVY